MQIGLKKNGYVIHIMIIRLYYIIKLDNQIPHPAPKFTEDSHGKPNEQLFSKKKSGESSSILKTEARSILTCILF